MSDGALIAAVALVAVIISLVLTEREPIKKANAIVDAEIIKKTNAVCKDNKTDVNLDIICKLRRRKAHLQKDIQNCAATWFIAALCFAAYGFSSNNLSLNDVEKTIALIASYIAMLTFSGGIYYLSRLLYEIKKIKSEVSVQ